MTRAILTPAILRRENADRAVELLRTYFGLGAESQAYTGASFEVLAANESDPMSISAADIVSLATLSVPVKGRTALELLGENFQTESRRLLGEIPPNATIDDEDAATNLAEQGNSPASRLWTLINNVHGMGSVSTSKLLARKRPALIPVYDRVIDAQLHLGGTTANMWGIYREWVNAPHDGGDSLIQYASDLGKRAELPQHVMPLRVIDVVLWMDGKDSIAVTHVEDDRNSTDA